MILLSRKIPNISKPIQKKVIAITLWNSIIKLWRHMKLDSKLTQIMNYAKAESKRLKMPFIHQVGQVHPNKKKFREQKELWATHKLNKLCKHHKSWMPYKISKITQQLFKTSWRIPVWQWRSRNSSRLELLEPVDYVYYSSIKNLWTIKIYPIFNIININYQMTTWIAENYFFYN